MRGRVDGRRRFGGRDVWIQPLPQSKRATEEYDSVCVPIFLSEFYCIKKFQMLENYKLLSLKGDWLRSNAPLQTEQFHFGLNNLRVPKDVQLSSVLKGLRLHFLLGSSPGGPRCAPSPLL